MRTFSLAAETICPCQLEEDVPGGVFINASAIETQRTVTDGNNVRQLVNLNRLKPVLP